MNSSGRTEDEQERCRIRLEAGEVLLQTCGPLAFHHEVSGDGVEDADGQDGDIGRPWHRALGVFGFLAVDRGGLEANERSKVEQQGDGYRAASEARPRERRGAQRRSATLAALDQDRRVEDEHDQEFQAHQDR
jgi:hypothetical protein